MLRHIRNICVRKRMVLENIHKSADQQSRQTNEHLHTWPCYKKNGLRLFSQNLCKCVENNFYIFTFSLCYPSHQVVIIQLHYLHTQIIKEQLRSLRNYKAMKKIQFKQEGVRVRKKKIDVQLYVLNSNLKISKKAQVVSKQNTYLLLFYTFKIKTCEHHWLKNYVKK